MSGTISSFVQHHEFFDVFLQHFLSIKKNRTPCRRELRKEGPKKSLWWRHQGQHVWYGEAWAQHTFPSSESGASYSPGYQELVIILFSQALGDQCGTESRIQQRVFKSGKEMIFRFLALRDQCGVCAFQAQGDLCDGPRTNLQERSWTAATCKSPAVNTWESLHKCSTEVESLGERTDIWFQSQCIDLEVIYVNNDESSSTCWAKLWWIFWVTYRNTNFKELKTLFDMTHKLIFDQDLEILNVLRLNGNLPVDEIHFATQPSDPVGESKSTRLLRFSFISGKDARAFRSQCKMERSAWRLPTVQRIHRTTWVQLDYFLRTYNVADSPKRFKTNWKLVKQVQDDFKIVTFSCPCSTTLIAQRQDILQNVFRVPNRVKKYSTRFQLGHWSFLGPREEENGM